MHWLTGLWKGWKALGNTTHHCRVEISTGDVIAEFTTEGRPSIDPIKNRVWNIAMGFVEARSTSRTQARLEAFQMRQKHLLTLDAYSSDAECQELELVH
jgi:hypothetical protein